MKHNSSHKANSVVFWFLWATVADGISSIPSALAKSQLFISICLFLISTMGTICSNCSSYSNNYCKIPFVVKFNVYLLNNNLQIFFFSFFFCWQPVTKHSSFLKLSHSFSVILFKYIFIAVLSPTSKVNIFRSSYELDIEEEKFVADVLSPHQQKYMPPSNSLSFYCLDMCDQPPSHKTKANLCQ